ncbi:MAG: hypothetical protein ACM31I_09230, partial [Deltaproteobacteria bacterium]
MTPTEYALFAGGAALLALFLARTVAPSFRNRFVKAADRASRDLREEFLVLSTRQTMAILLAAGGLLAAAAILLARDIVWA